MVTFLKSFDDEPEPKNETYEGMAPVRTVKRFAFDVDGTLIKKTDNGDVPRYEIVQMAITLCDLGHTVFVWSGGGVDYAREWARKLGLLPFIRVLAKSKNYDIDVCFDDHAVDLAKVNVIV
jgi:hypothetical protein